MAGVPVLLAAEMQNVSVIAVSDARVAGWRFDGPDDLAWVDAVSVGDWVPEHAPPRPRSGQGTRGWAVEGWEEIARLRGAGWSLGALMALNAAGDARPTPDRVADWVVAAGRHLRWRRCAWRQDWRWRRFG